MDKLVERYSAEWWRDYRVKNKERLRAYKRKYDTLQYELHPERETARRKRWADKNRYKVRAHQAVHYAVRTGGLIKGHCPCGATKVIAHHDDYAKPLEVLWLCEIHHKERHNSR